MISSSLDDDADTVSWVVTATDTGGTTWTVARIGRQPAAPAATEWVTTSTGDLRWQQPLTK